MPVLGLIEFVFRLSFGLAVALLLVARQPVTCGFFQKHLWVIMGLAVLAAAALFGLETPVVNPWLAVAVAALAYVGSVVWLYDARRIGMAFLAAVAGVSLAGAYASARAALTVGWGAAPAAAHPDLSSVPGWIVQAAATAEPAASGLVLGITLGAMFLGHWYLNTPTMVIAPLERLVLAMGTALGLRAVVCGGGLALLILGAGLPGATTSSFLALRWLSGLVGAAVVAVMTWQTLKIPNTQSATGILYVGVIVTFLGELTGRLLSAGGPLPL